MLSRVLKRSRHVDSADSVKAIIAAMYAQLNRPADPLWDPDPLMSKISQAVGADDPTLDTIAEWEAEVEVARKAEVAREAARIAAGTASRFQIPDRVRELGLKFQLDFHRPGG